MPARILLVEDDYASRALLQYLVESAGYKTLVADDGASGLRLAHEGDPDLVVCDVHLPLLNGYELVRRLLNDTTWRRVPVIAVTASSMRGDREIALAAGFTDHIAKPIDPEQFIAQIEAFLPAELCAPRAGAPSQRSGA
jgi:two-component system cell cycle response regulator DivK